MIVKAYKKSEPIAQIVCLQMENLTGGINIFAVDCETGDRCPGGNILKITPEGVRLNSSITKKLGFTLGTLGKIVVLNPV
jgi:hypothetical protein